MSIEELLKTRIVVLANYPYSPYQIGQQVNMITDGMFHILTVKVAHADWKGGHSDMEVMAPVSQVDNCPALFRKLLWWEQRAIEDLPQYVRFEEYNDIFKIKQWSTDLFIPIIKQLSPCGYAEIPEDYLISLRVGKNYPATEDEYLAYRAKKDKR